MIRTSSAAADPRTTRRDIPALPFCHVRLRAQKPLPPAHPRELRTLGDHLRKRRLDLGLLQSEVAERLAVDETTIYNWERHRTQPARQLVPRILRFVGYTPRPRDP